MLTSSKMEVLMTNTIFMLYRINIFLFLFHFILIPHPRRKSFVFVLVCSLSMIPLSRRRGQVTELVGGTDVYTGNGPVTAGGTV